MYLLEKPAVAVRVAEGGERAVVGVLGCGPVDAPRRPGVMEDSGDVVEALADVDAPPEKVRPGLVDVVDRELQAFEGSGRRRGEPLPKMMEQVDPGE